VIEKLTLLKLTDEVRLGPLARTSAFSSLCALFHDVCKTHKKKCRKFNRMAFFIEKSAIYVISDENALTYEEYLKAIPPNQLEWIDFDGTYHGPTIKNGPTIKWV
jgi:hypothetical protein